MIKFLIIRFSSIGDIVLTTPVVRCLKQQVDEVEIHYLTKIQFAEILQPNPNIFKIHILKDNLQDTIKELKTEQFDYIIDLHNNIRTYRLKQKFGIPAFSFEKLNYEKWLIVNFKINKLPNVHIVDRYLETLNVFDVKNDNKGLDYYILSKDEINTLPSYFSNGFIAFVIGANHYTKKLPVEKIISVCNKIDLPIILLGGKGDEIDGNIIANSTGEKIYNCCGKYNISQTASIIKQARLVITPDTGMMHIASAFHKRIVSIWGNTIPEFGMYPYFAEENSKIIEIKNLKCRPCSKIGFKECPKKHFKCMREISNDIIAETSKNLFHKKSI